MYTDLLFFPLLRRIWCILGYLKIFFLISVSYTLFVTTHPLCFSDNSFEVTHLDFDAFVKFLAGGRDGLSGAKLKVPELVLHPEEREGKQRTDMFLTNMFQQKIFPDLTCTRVQCCEPTA